MPVRDILPLTLSFWPFLFGHCFLASFIILFEYTQGELQKSCMQVVMEEASGNCQRTCQCRPYPPLPPPPPPPPPPRLLIFMVAGSNVPPIKPWWKESVVLGTATCVSLVFLLLTALVCYKAIKRMNSKQTKSPGVDSPPSLQKTSASCFYISPDQ